MNEPRRSWTSSLARAVARWLKTEGLINAELWDLFDGAHQSLSKQVAELRDQVRGNAADLFDARQGLACPQCGSSALVMVMPLAVTNAAAPEMHMVVGGAFTCPKHSPAFSFYWMRDPVSGLTHTWTHDQSTVVVRDHDGKTHVDISEELPRTPPRVRRFRP